MRKGSVKEVLAKIKYDPRENEEDYFIIIEHRGSYGNVRKIPVSLIELGHGYFFVGETQIPYHRILKVVRKDGRVVWESRKRGLK
ncbi:hypothetical protein PFDSM3638_06485 [Pyrococcus furiosus DSM 3638]|uniref:UPF0248 protein PF1300 n=3 Tax=Pyrococcus furiosus TaxID=2261 RepID=Y1300_PYRFU|nr:DUF504 domain-containing protein [Pyrococcus furiosus]Q8U1C1.1 RecName: Full=UPF0248 protein PF1300 [Pyrococcus furiosus DSM 3638]AAL81424.1 hypothetical protein PF1300 [Pyrococcus furiosus DSM 3638]AFN04084.1 hypothetical protein PFC_05715 [Pyrococcus furiosus COM1]QEK78940.1 hypothetical protein PFDSM3638_06485 [Pyrococcus furiosus DSM 3638]